MSLETQINSDIKAAMLAKETVRLTALRAIKAAILLEKTADGSSEISDEAVLKIIQKQIKQRKESAAEYAKAGRQELADNELAEAACMECFLPKQLTPEELETAVAQIVAATGASSPADMGKVMGAATKQLAGKSDGKAISEIVKRLLNK